MRFAWLAMLWCCCFSRAAVAQVRLHPLFQNDAVLQRDAVLPIWGTARPGETVTVSLGRQSAQAIADESGHFLARLAAQALSTKPLTLTAQSASGKAQASNILLGDVWLCSGQSNMEFALGASDSARDIENARFAYIRQFGVELNFATSPQRELKGQWVACSPATAAGFSAVAFFFARRIHQETGVPIGIIRSAVGGTNIELWMSQESLLETPALQATAERMRASLQRYEAELSQGGDAPEHPFGEKRRDPRCVTLYNGMIHPLLPMSMRGILWYQGENNAGSAEDGELYTPKLVTMVADWRRRFEQADLPFYYVQLAAWHYANYDADNADSWAYLREGQRRALPLIERSGMAVAIDIGDDADIHPKNKFDVGERLARWALRDCYAQKLPVSGPLFRELLVEKGTLRLRFDHAESGLMAGKKEGRAPVQPDPKGNVRGFAIAGADKHWRWAKARIEGSELVLEHPEIPQPVAVRYAFASNPERANLYNQDGLPASPFRTDSW